MRRSVDFLHSLYDALVSINVPSDKARAVVDAMERDTATTLAIRHDLQPFATREDVLLVKQDFRLLQQQFDATEGRISQKLDLLKSDLTVRLSSMVAGGVALLEESYRLVARGVSASCTTPPFVPGP
jgi:hypothetical protein